MEAAGAAASATATAVVCGSVAGVVAAAAVALPFSDAIKALSWTNEMESDVSNGMQSASVWR